ncbi:Basic-leucine zipper (bZIP) transcription factor [Fusarium denticulatum]|uniref:Basic-leucine zipper (BZIP) transcription factor n=1 Tax=Fusarium denticulatum TaxID=48507 RepID=A0A8H5UM08_9HYPO|nr:Basic-leucine zipper (bZIP) transcription factor [Fusarium denticulatum]
MFLEEVLEPTPKKSRSRRSTSPRAVQRRRLSQRNHRRRAKESSEATKILPQYAGEGEGVNSEVLAVPMSDNSTMQQGCGLDPFQNLHYLQGSYHEPLQYASSSENSVDYFERQQLSHSQLSSAPATATSAWYSAVDMHNLIAPEDMVSLFSPDREWSQSDIERFSEPVLGQIPEGFPLWRQNEQGPDMRRIPSAQSHSDLDSHRIRSETGHHGPGPGLHNSAAGMPYSTLQGHVNACCSSRLSSLSSSKVSSSAEETSPSPVAELTRRFDSILETMRTSGFHNFDEMAVAYYTGRFSTGSVPSIMQCSSRGRRLKVILQKLHQDSQEWPKWESRGLHESMSTATGKD